VVLIEVWADVGDVELSNSVVCADVAHTARSRMRADRMRTVAVFIFDSLVLAAIK